MNMFCTLLIVVVVWCGATPEGCGPIGFSMTRTNSSGMGPLWGRFSSWPPPTRNWISTLMICSSWARRNWYRGFKVQIIFCSHYSVFQFLRYDVASRFCFTISIQKVEECGQSDLFSHRLCDSAFKFKGVYEHMFADRLVWVSWQWLSIFFYVLCCFV